MMKPLFTCIVVSILCVPCLLAQEKLNVREAYRKEAKKFTFITLWKQKDPDLLTQRLCAGASSDEEKVAIIAGWLTRKVAFDKRGLRINRWWSYSPQATLKRRKALAGEYSELFVLMCDAVDIEALAVAGYVRAFDFLPGDTIYHSNHGWAVVNLNGQWWPLDLSLAKGMIVPKRQYIRRFLYWAFKVPYVPRTKFKNRLNPEWIMVDPRRLIFSHHPNLSLFQLTYPPLPVEAFALGMEAVDSTLIELGSTTNHQLGNTRYPNLRTYDRWEFEAEATLEHNPSNAYFAGVSCLSMLDSLHRKHYNVKGDSLVASASTLMEMKNLSERTDSLLKQGYQNVDRAYHHKNARNKAWKDTVRKYDKASVREALLQIRTAQKQLRNLKRLRLKNRNLTRKLSALQRKVPSSAYSRTQRPDVNKAERPDSTAFRTRHAEYMVEVQTQKSAVDSVWTSLSAAEQDSLASEALQATAIHQSNYHQLIQWMMTRGQFFNIYPPDTDLKKQWLSTRLDSAAALNQSTTDTLIALLLTNQLDVYTHAKAGLATVKEAQKQLANCKRTNAKNFQEDSLYQTITQDYDQFLQSSIDISTSYLQNSNALDQSLRQQVRLLKRILRRLREDMVLEGSRHNVYRFTIKNQREAGRRNMKYFQKRLKELRDDVERAI